MGVAGHHMPVWFDEDTEPTDGQVVAWSAARGRFEPVSGGGGGGGIQTIDGNAPDEAGDVDLSDTYVGKTGDTMTGPLVLPGSPTLPLQAATKAYVDAAAPTVPDATTGVKGIVRLAGDLAGTAALPTVPGLATNAAAIVAEAATARAAEGAEAVTRAAADTALASTIAGAAFGITAGAIIKPWLVPPPIGPELAVVANLRSGYNTTLPIPTLTANSTNQNSRTLISLGNVANADLAFRVKMTVAALPTNGWATVKLRPVDAGGNIIAGAVEQVVVTAATNAFGGTLTGPFEMDFKVANAWSGGGGVYLEVRLDVFNNASAGTLQVSNLSVREIAAPQRPMLFSQLGGGVGTLPTSGYVQVWQPLFDPVANVWRMVETDLQTDGALQSGLNTVTAYNTDRPFQYDRPDPDFAATAAASTDPVNKQAVSLGTGEFSRSMRVGNNDQIMEVQKADLSYELRCNTHGGETLRSTSSPNLVWEYDLGDGAWNAWTGGDLWLRHCRRFRFTFKTKVARSAPDSDDFANVDHVCTFFPDGMMRMDRTTTFLKAMRVRSHFEWMSSHDLTVPKIGRIGRGLTVEDEVDVYVRLATPAAPTAATATTGGVLPAATYTYLMTELTEAGETLPSVAVTQVTTGSTSTVTLTPPAASTGCTGRRIYGRIGGTGRQVLLATIPATAATWVDDGSVAAFGQQPPRVNTARRLDTATTAQDSAVSAAASWAVWMDLPTGMCFGNIYDRDAVLARTGVAGVKLRLERGSGIMKNYLNTYWTGDGNPSLPASETRLVASGEVWTATHYAFAYMPTNPDEYHNEIAVRAAYLSSLATLYPAT